LAHVVAFGFSSYCSVVNRTTKPFNPLLGETWEYEEDDLRIIGE
jgi:hypothetical protein